MSEFSEKPDRKRSGRSKPDKNKSKKNKQESTSAVEIVCSECNEIFLGRNALYRHLETHGVERESIHAVRPNKVILLVGWLSDVKHDDKWSIDGHLAHSWSVLIDNVEKELWDAIDAVDGIDEDSKDAVRGLSRASGCAQRSSHLLQMEPSCHSVADVFCFQLKKKSRPKDTTWMNAVNEHLPYNIRVVDVYNPPPACCEFHAETVCSQRRFEYVLPLSVFFPKSEDDVDDGSFKPIANKKSPWNKMDKFFPRDTKEGVERIENFRKLKLVLKLFNGRHSMHNFVTGGASPDEGHIKKRLDRFYHKELLMVNEGGEDQDITVYRDALSPMDERVDSSSSPVVTEWAVFSLSGNDFLKGQVRKMVGLAIGVFRGWLSKEFLDVALNSDRIVNIPAAPACGLYLAECKFDKWEAKYGLPIDPRRVEGGDLSRITDWLRTVQHKAVAQMTSELRTDWLDKLRLDCEQSMAEFTTENALLAREATELQQQMVSCRTGIPSHLPNEVREAYANALRCLREAEASGQWPASSLARQKVITPESLGEDGSAGGTFSVGVLPAPLVQPRGNELFPELLLACFHLEKVLFPSRLPSSTIAINRHAQFRPHRDTGAGSGQTTSLIVGLGDYGGGELMVECQVNDIRYNAIEFDGWGERHWGLPFEGERFSLVWFTPLGVNIPDDLWWLDRI